LDTRTTILDIIRVNPQCTFSKIAQEYKLRYNIEEWREVPFGVPLLKFLEKQRWITESNGKHTITDSGEKIIDAQKKWDKKSTNKRNFEKFLKYILLPGVSIAALIIAIIK